MDKYRNGRIDFENLCKGVENVINDFRENAEFYISKRRLCETVSGCLCIKDIENKVNELPCYKTLQEIYRHILHREITKAIELINNELEARKEAVKTISRKEYENLKRRYDELKVKFDEFVSNYAKVLSVVDDLKETNIFLAKELDKARREVEVLRLENTSLKAQLSRDVSTVINVKAIEGTLKKAYEIIDKLVNENDELRSIVKNLEEKVKELEDVVNTFKERYPIAYKTVLSIVRTRELEKQFKL